MLKSCSRRQAWYLYKKWNRGDITESMINRLFTPDAVCDDIFGGWFVDFYYDSLLDKSW